MQRLIFIFIFAFYISNGVINYPAQVTAPRKSDAVSNKIFAQIPFEFYGGHIYLRVRVNNSEPHWFLLDSGAQIAHIRMELAQTLGLKMGGSLGVTGTGTERIKANYVKDVTYKVSGAEFTDDQSIALPTAEFFQPLENSFGHEFDGVLGYNLLNRYVVEVDYASQMINLYDPTGYAYQGTGEVIPIRINDKKPYLTATLTPLECAPIQSNFHVDLGNGGGLSLNGNFVAENNLIQCARTTIESFSRGAGGETATRVGRVKNLQVGHFTLSNPTASFSLVQGKGVRSDSVGRIGGGILSRFKVILDYSRKQLILEPNAAFTALFEADMSGISLLSEKPDFKTFTIYKLLPGTPAAEAGAREGDVILSVDNKQASELTLEQIRETLRQDKKSVTLKLRRGGETLEVTLKLRRLI